MTKLSRNITTQNQYEINVFEMIKDDVNIVLDIGCREDYGYSFLKPEAEVYSFDVHPQFIESINNKVKGKNLNIKTFRYGISNKNSKVSWSGDSQSIQNHRLWGELSTFEVRKFDEVLEENNIKQIDFIKMDIEGSEPEILEYHDILKDVKYIQFECGLAWSDIRKFNFKHVIDQYKDTHDALFIRDDNHSMCDESSELLTIITKDYSDRLLDCAYRGEGVNILLVKKELIEVV